MGHYHMGSRIAATGPPRRASPAPRKITHPRVRAVGQARNKRAVVKRQVQDVGLLDVYPDAILNDHRTWYFNRQTGHLWTPSNTKRNKDELPTLTSTGLRDEGHHVGLSSSERHTLRKLLSIPARKPSNKSQLHREYRKSSDTTKFHRFVVQGERCYSKPHVAPRVRTHERRKMLSLATV
jgi:hypothetical protein